MSMTTAVILSEKAAKTLTERIRKAGEDWATAILEAHEAEVWRTLKYATWADYVAGERLDFNVRQSYNLLAQGRADRDLAAIGAPVHTSAREAREIVKNPTIVQRVAHNVQAGDQPSAALQAALAEQREGAALPKESAALPPPPAAPSPLAQSLAADQRSAPIPKPTGGKRRGFSPPPEMVARWCETLETWADQMGDEAAGPELDRVLQRLVAVATSLRIGV